MRPPSLALGKCGEHLVDAAPVQVDHLELPWGWFGPLDEKLDGTARRKYSLVTSVMIQKLLAAEPWVATRVPISPVSFKAVGWFTELADAYAQVDEDHIQALWESTHCPWVSKEQARTNKYLTPYYNARKKRCGRET